MRRSLPLFRRIKINCAWVHPKDCDELLVPALKAGDGAIRLPGSLRDDDGKDEVEHTARELNGTRREGAGRDTHSHAEAALAGRVGALVPDDIGVLEPRAEHGCLLVRDGGLEKAGVNAKDGQEGEERKVGASHGVGVVLW